MRVLTLSLALALAVPACGRGADDEPALATPSVTFSRTRVALGSVVDVRYRFQVAASLPPVSEDYRVFVHFLDDNGEMMWSDDHMPAVPTTQWKAGQVVEYERTLFVPVYPFLGEAPVRLGLYSTKTGRRRVLTGESPDQRSYQVATLQLAPHSENVFVLFKDGWHPAEVAQGNQSVEWQWTRRAATLSFRNPRKDATFYLHADHPGKVFTEPQTVYLRLNGQDVDSFTLRPGQETIRRTQLTSAQFGSDDMVELALEVDKTYVPALVSGSGSQDQRELGIRVFHALVQTP